jgi:hypothetical protein
MPPISCGALVMKAYHTTTGRADRKLCHIAFVVPKSQGQSSSAMPAKHGSTTARCMSRDGANYVILLSPR